MFVNSALEWDDLRQYYKSAFNKMPPNAVHPVVAMKKLADVWRCNSVEPKVECVKNGMASQTVLMEIKQRN